jgi:signal transduction histidine kinase
LQDRAPPRALATKPCSLTDVVRRAVNVARAQVFGKGEGNRITVQFDAPVEPVIALIDPAQIEDAVLNLIINAIEAYETNGSVNVRLFRSPRDEPNEHGEEVVIEVSDQGRGINEENLSRIFHPFFTTTEGGTGLGLPAVRRIARAHSGRVEVKSLPGEGSTFMIHLPLTVHN